MKKFLSRFLGKKRKEEEAVPCTVNSNEPRVVQTPVIRYVPKPCPVCDEKTCPLPPPTVSKDEDVSTTQDPRVVVSLAITAVTSTMVLILLAWNFLFRRRARLQRRLMKMDNQMILTKIEELTEELEDRDNERDVLEQRIRIAKQTGEQDKAEMGAELSKQIEEKDAQRQSLQWQLDEAIAKNKEADSKLDEFANELRRYEEEHHDYECQMLEQKLQGSRLTTALQEKETRLEELSQMNLKQAERIQDLEQKIKTDAQKAEKIINDLMAEKDNRFSILQEENDAIKKTVLGLLYQTQEKYDRDKILLKKEMRNRDEKIGKLQQELWKSNALLKRLQNEDRRDLSESVSQLILEKETEDTAPKERRSSTYEVVETILEDDSQPEELKEIENYLHSTMSNGN